MPGGTVKPLDQAVFKALDIVNFLQTGFRRKSVENFINLFSMFSDCGRKPECPHTRNENMQTPHRKTPAEI